ncbi:protein lin-52 homolog isoform X2 [Diabrotica virgifera virgifera]|uniref:Protein lin-52 homolog n=1 Tax=Diabrotica virgifera virgifera TaxID=50390 RepID=A0ABM5KBA5_DIAVI|nr:protein lin-52 homolog isoform X2 [Diabrotica virgifera virgifera]
MSDRAVTTIGATGAVPRDPRRSGPAIVIALYILPIGNITRLKTYSIAEEFSDSDQEELREFGSSLISMENLDRASPELWPEKIPGVTEFINSFQTTPNSTTKLPYSKELTHEDQNYVHQLATLSTSGLIGKVKELHDIAYQLGIEESKEVTRGKYLNLFNRDKKHK